MSNSLRPQRWQAPGSPHPWDSPGKNSGVGCHFLLQCMKVKSESEVAQSCPTLSNPMDYSPPGPSVHGIFQAKVLEWGAIAFSSVSAQSLKEETEGNGHPLQYFFLGNAMDRGAWRATNHGMAKRRRKGGICGRFPPFGL